MLEIFTRPSPVGSVISVNPPLLKISQDEGNSACSITPMKAASYGILAGSVFSMYDVLKPPEVCSILKSSAGAAFL